MIYGNIRELHLIYQLKTLEPMGLNNMENIHIILLVQEYLDRTQRLIVMNYIHTVIMYMNSYINYDISNREY